MIPNYLTTKYTLNLVLVETSQHNNHQTIIVRLTIPVVLEIELIHLQKNSPVNQTHVHGFFYHVLKNLSCLRTQLHSRLGLILNT